MSPTAIDTAPVPVAVAAPTKGPALVIGSPSTAQDGRYQGLITELEASREVEKQMLDRILDGGTISSDFRPPTYSSFGSYHAP